MTSTTRSAKKTSEHQALVRALTAENKRLHSRIAKLETQIISLKNRASSLEAEIKSGSNRQMAEILGEIMQRAQGADSSPGTHS